MPQNMFYNIKIRTFAATKPKLKVFFMVLTTAFPNEGGIKNERTMKQIVNEISMLQYRIKRYQTMRNGIMCQALKTRLEKLLVEQQTHVNN